MQQWRRAMLCLLAWHVPPGRQSPCVPACLIPLPVRLSVQLEGAALAGESRVKAQAAELEGLKAANRELQAVLEAAQVGPRACGCVAVRGRPPLSGRRVQRRRASAHHAGAACTKRTLQTVTKMAGPLLVALANLGGLGAFVLMSPSALAEGSFPGACAWGADQPWRHLLVRLQAQVGVTPERARAERQRLVAAASEAQAAADAHAERAQRLEAVLAFEVRCEWASLCPDTLNGMNGSRSSWASLCPDT